MGFSRLQRRGVLLLPGTDQLGKKVLSSCPDTVVSRMGESAGLYSVPLVTPPPVCVCGVDVFSCPIAGVRNGTSCSCDYAVDKTKTGLRQTSM